MAERLLDQLWHLSPQTVCLLDRDGRIVRANRAAAARLNAGDPADLIGRDAFAHLPAPFALRRRQRLSALLDPVRAARTPQSVAERIPAPDGTTRLVRCTLAPLDPDGPGDDVGADTGATGATGATGGTGPGPAVAVLFEDEEVAPEALPGERRSEARFRNAFEQAPHGMALLDAEGRWRRVNRALMAMLGRGEADLIGRSVLSVTHPDDWGQDTQWLDAVLAGSTVPFDAEKRFVRADGSILWAHVTGAMMRDRDGTPREIIAQIADTTRRRAAEDALRASESRFRETFAAAPHGMAIVSLDGRFEEVNGALCRILGHDETSLLTLDVAAVTHIEDHNLELEAARRLLAGDLRVFSGEKRYVRRDGTIVRAHVSLALARNGDGQPRHFITHVQDITRQVESEARLHEAIAAAEQALLAKTRFLAAASHDLRQPLQALNLFVSVLSGRETDPDKQAILGKVDRALTSLADLMNTLLDISRLEAGAVLPDLRRFDARVFLARLAEEFGPVADQAGLRLRLVLPRGDEALPVFTDPALLEVILRNLIGNALKYTDPGGRVLVGVRRRDGGRRLRLEVVDTGRGIPADHLALIFEDFHRVRDGSSAGGSAPAAAAAARPGLGLGLGIVNRVGRLLGTIVSVRSVPGRGSRFWLDLPCHTPESDAVAGHAAPVAAIPEGEALPPDAAAVGLGGTGGAPEGPCHLVVVDDEASVRESLTLLLEGWGHRVTAFVGLSDLTEALLTETLTPPPDGMLVDYRLPSGRTGLDAVALARTHLRRPIPALLLTGEIDTHTLRDIRRGGLPVLQKPVRPDLLRVRVADLLAARWGAAPAPQTAPPSEVR